MFALRTRRAFYSELCLGQKTLSKFQYHTTTIRMQEQGRPKDPLLKSVISKIYGIPATVIKIIYGIPRQTSHVNTAGEREGRSHSTNREEIKIEQNYLASPAADSSYPQDSPRSILRAKINRLRILLGPPQKTIRSLDLIPADVIIENDPQYDVISSCINDAHGCTIQDPGSPPILSLRRLPYALDIGSLPQRPGKMPGTMEQIDTGMVDVSSTPTQMDNLLYFCLGKSQSSCFVFYVQSDTLVMLTRSPDLWSSAATSGPVDPPHNIWGMTFEETFTTREPGIPPWSSYVQTIQYTFGNLAIALRREIDAFDDASSRVPKRLKAQGKPAIYPSTGPSIRSSDMLELKCLHRKTWKAAVNHEIGKSWFARRKRLLVGLHNGDGVVDELQTVDLGEMTQRWKLRRNIALLRLHDLLCRLRVEATKSKSGICWALRNNATGDADLDIFSLDSSHGQLYETYKHLARTEHGPKAVTKTNLLSD